MVGGTDEASELGGRGWSSNACLSVSRGINPESWKGGLRSRGCLRNCWTAGGSGSSSSSAIRSSGGSSLSSPLLRVSSSPTSTIFPLLDLLAGLLSSSISASTFSITASTPFPLPRPATFPPLHELLIPPPLPNPRSSPSRPSPLSDNPEVLLPSSSTSEDSSRWLPPKCLLDLCKA